VRKTLHREKLIKPKKKKTPSNPSKPRFFRARHAQSDVAKRYLSFKLVGKLSGPPNGWGRAGMPT